MQEWHVPVKYEWCNKTRVACAFQPLGAVGAATFAVALATAWTSGAAVMIVGTALMGQMS